jgi:hypothetical protein
MIMPELIFCAMLSLMRASAVANNFEYMGWEVLQRHRYNQDLPPNNLNLFGMLEYQREVRS